MITEVYSLDALLVNSYDTIVTVGIQSMVNGVWATPEPLDPSKIISESLEIKQSICDTNELDIGGCIPSQLTLNVMDTPDLTGKRITVTVQGRYVTDLYPSDSLYPSDNLYPNTKVTGEYLLFIGPIYSCKKTNNYKIRKLVAFDRMYYASTVLCKNKIYKYLVDVGEMSLNFSSLFVHFFNAAKITVNTTDFVNNATTADIYASNWQNVIDNNFTFLDYYKCLSELNGVFLIEDTPSIESITSSSARPRAIKLYQDKWLKYTISSYSSLSYEDYVTKEIRYVQFDFNNDNFFTYIYYTPYIGYSSYISDNPVTRCIMTGNDFDIIGKLGGPYKRGYYKSTINPDTTPHAGSSNVIVGDIYQYRPFKASIFNRWWVQVGDRIKLPTSDPDVPYVESIVLSRTLKGLYGMRVEIEAKGVEVFGKENDESII